MNKNMIKYVVGAILAALLFQFVLVPLISRNKAKTTVQKVLKSWVAHDSAAAMKSFQSPAKFPPVYDLQSYEIKSHKFESVNGKPRAVFRIILNFGPNNALPTGKTWVCELNVDKGLWMVSEFYLEQ